MKTVKSQSAKIELSHAHSYSGPIPDPDSLARYEQIQPGFAERIILMAEGEAEHRRKNETKLIKNKTGMAVAGITFAFITVVLFCLLIFYALHKGYNTATLGIAIGAVASVAGVFIFFRSTKEKKQQ